MQFQNEIDEQIPEDLKSLMTQIDSYFEGKGINTIVDLNQKALEYLLYDSFVWEFAIESRYGIFSASLAIGDGFRGVTSLLGRKLSLNCDEESILANLEIIDKYCRLRLPNKFLTEFESEHD